MTDSINMTAMEKASPGQSSASSSVGNGDEKHSFDSSSEDSRNSLLQEMDDTEAMLTPESTPAGPSRGRKAIFVAVYFFLNLALTLSNKSVLSHESVPWLLTTFHTSATSIGCFVLMGTGHLSLTSLTTRENLTLVAFSFLFTLNIAISNVSLAMVSVPFHQIMRSTCPVVTIAIMRTIYGKTYDTATYLSLIPLIFGVGLATAGDYQASLLGVLLTALGVLLACIKTIATNRLMTGSLKLPPTEVLLRMSPLAALQCMIYATLTGEVTRFRDSYAAGDIGLSLGIAFLLNATMAFALNVVSFQTNKMIGAVAVTVCGNVKQALTIMLGIIFFSVPVGIMNAVGMAVTMAGAAWYSKIELDRKKASS